MTTITLIDLSSIFWQMWHATADLEVNETYRRTVDKVHALTSGSEHAAVCCDFPPYKRKEILATYKSQRDTPSEVAVEQLRRIKERLFEDGYPIWESPGYEADDIIASATRMAVERGMRVQIASGDKDLMQLVSDTVQVTSVQTGKVFDVSAVSETWGVAPELLGDVLALIGDKSDNVPGVPGVGPKWAAKLIATHGTLEDILCVAPTIPGAIGRALQANADIARLAARLIRLDDTVPIAFDECLQQRGPTMDAQEAEFTEAEPEPEPELAAQAASPTPAPPTQPVREPEPPGTALAIIPTQKWELQLEPTSSGGAVKLAKYLFESRLFGQLPNEQAVLAIILRGRSLGLDATTALANFHVIKGRPVMNAALLVGIVIRSGAAEYIEWTESDARHAVWVTKRKGNRSEQSLKWTIDDALNACLVERHQNGLDGYRGISESGKASNWDKYRATMLRWRCGVELCRSVYPDIVAGLWIPDEPEGAA